jgi:hypothetical protein
MQLLYFEARDFKVGDTVTVKGLKTKPQHNGKTGTVIGLASLSAARDRVEVRLQDNTMTELVLKSDNVKRNMDELNKNIVVRMIDNARDRVQVRLHDTTKTELVLKPDNVKRNMDELNKNVVVRMIDNENLTNHD